MIVAIITKLLLQGPSMVIMLLIFGAISSSLAKICMQFQSKGYMGIVHYFEKPAFQAFCMFVGMALAIFICPRWGPRGPVNLKELTLKQYFYPIFSSILGVLNMIVLCCGLTRIEVSTCMMLHGGLSIFSTIFSIIFLKRHVYFHQWAGIFLTILSLLIVGYSGVHNNTDSRHTAADRTFGVILVLCALVLQGGELVWDEYILKVKKLPIMFVVAMEGVWGSFFVVFIVWPLGFILPGRDPSPLGGSFENPIDSVLMVIHCPALFFIIIAAILTVLIYNTFGMIITCTMSSMHRTIFEALRTLSTWFFMLFISLCGSPYGEKWCVWSWLQLGGFVVLVLGSLVFNEIISVERFNIFKCSKDDETSL